MNELDDVVKRMQSQVNVIDAKQEEYKKKSDEDNGRYEEFRNFLMETQRTNKSLWIPIVFSVICTIVSALLPIFF